MNYKNCVVTFCFKIKIVNGRYFSLLRIPKRGNYTGYFIKILNRGPDGVQQKNHIQENHNQKRNKKIVNTKKKKQINEAKTKTNHHKTKLKAKHNENNWRTNNKVLEEKFQEFCLLKGIDKLAKKNYDDKVDIDNIQTEDSFISSTISDFLKLEQNLSISSENETEEETEQFRYNFLDDYSEGFLSSEENYFTNSFNLKSFIESYLPKSIYETLCNNARHNVKEFLFSNFKDKTTKFSDHHENVQLIIDTITEIIDDTNEFPDDYSDFINQLVVKLTRKPFSVTKTFERIEEEFENENLETELENIQQISEEILNQNLKLIIGLK